MKASRLVLGLVLIATAAFAVGLAHDIRAWQRALDTGDQRFTTAPGAARWAASTWAPIDIARAGLGLDDDLSVRRAEQAFARALAAPKGLDNGVRQARLRAAAEVALSDVIVGGSPVEASRAGNLLGILIALSESGSDPAVSERAAQDTFDAAIRADPANADPKYNLELLLRRIRVVGTREGPGSGSGNRGDSLQGAGAGTPGSGY